MTKQDCYLHITDGPEDRSTSFGTDEVNLHVSGIPESIPSYGVFRAQFRDALQKHGADTTGLIDELKRGGIEVEVAQPSDPKATAVEKTLSMLSDPDTVFRLNPESKKATIINMKYDRYAARMREKIDDSTYARTLMQMIIIEELRKQPQGIPVGAIRLRYREMAQSDKRLGSQDFDTIFMYALQNFNERNFLDYS